MGQESHLHDASHAWATRQSVELPKSSSKINSGLSQGCAWRMRGSSHVSQQEEFLMGVRNMFHKSVVQIPALETALL